MSTVAMARGIVVVRVPCYKVSGVTYHFLIGERSMGVGAEPERPGIKIAELARRAQVTRATIHHYVHEGLLPEPVKTSRNMALYDPECVERVLLVKGLQRQERRSLAEVKVMLEGVPGHEGIARLRSILESEASRSSPLEESHPRAPIARETLATRTGLSIQALMRLEAAGVLASRERGRRRFFGPLDVDLAFALANLARAGFDRAHGFKPAHVAMYVGALRDLLQKEVALFFERVGADESSDEVLARARRGLEGVTPLLLAIRRKLVGELLAAATVPKTRKHAPERRGRKP
jgi:DNA-binding transcriptional MerR regulator